MQKKLFTKGYSLIELVIYIALFSVISVLIVKSLTTVMKTYSTAQGYRRLQGNGELVMERIVREVRASDSITTGSSTFGTSPGTLALAETDSGGSAHAITFDVSSGVARITDNGTTSALTSGEVTVSSLTFWRITTTVGEGIRAKLVLTTANGYAISGTFYTTVLTRAK